MNKRFLKMHVHKEHFLPIDLHGMSLRDSLDFIISKSEECVIPKLNGLKIIHGYHRGTTYLNRDIKHSKLFSFSYP